MDLSRYSLKDLLLTALKSEIESRDLYLKLAESVKNFLLKDRLNFLAEEEKKHKILFETLFRKNFSQGKII